MLPKLQNYERLKYLKFFNLLEMKNWSTELFKQKKKIFLESD